MDARLHHGPRPSLRAAVLLVSALALATGCTDHGAEEPPDQRPRPVQTLILEDPDQLAERRFTSRVAAQNRAWVSFRVGGELEGVHAEVGDRVAAGERLAELDDSDHVREVDELEAQLEAARARQAYAATEYLRAAQLVEEEAITQSEYDQAARQRDEAQAEAASLQAGLALARDRLAYTRLRAPFDGAVAERRFDTHEAVPPQEPVYLLEDLSQLEVEVGIPEEFMVYRDHLQQVQVRIPALDAVYPGRIRTVGVDVLPERQTYPVQVALTEPGEQLLPGMTAEVIFHAEMDPSEGFRIPLTALHEHDNEHQVWLRGDDGTVRRQAVELIALDRRSALVADGLETGDEVVTAGVHHLAEGQPTRRMDPEAP
ncbi:efflux RND transporter periplasmic adaptor subunit [Halorhodospira halophila]|uniref:Efflux transporter, RND family, MFP subunit n=1 Tax=Halorhodospira halophila (strain DSM 244 / SL1) TaxID=349124 RepID=A1WZE4_HALHL|nr:efflux RND transporter periplasmic adaptor subunit [Halorhodospira halophila]ABM63056.1 efflux transporter, RND family, MFP subunit [Halorhodospira halophila SL1]MBK1727822.1 efflux RND transporter periplasmic adaptor subunit [Halorhodospira halophila]